MFRTKRSDDDTSDEEREWLQALEAGELDDSGAVKKSKDPKLLTARQVGQGRDTLQCDNIEGIVCTEKHIDVIIRLDGPPIIICTSLCRSQRKREQCRPKWATLKMMYEPSNIMAATFGCRIVGCFPRHISGVRVQSLQG